MNADAGMQVLPFTGFRPSKMQHQGLGWYPENALAHLDAVNLSLQVVGCHGLQAHTTQCLGLLATPPFVPSALATPPLLRRGLMLSNCVTVS